MKRVITLTEVIIIILIALALAVLAWRESDWQMEIRIIIMLAAIAVLAVAIVAAIMWVEYQQALIAEVHARAAAHSERVLLAEKLAGLNHEQIALLSRYNQMVEIAGGDGDYEPIQFWRLLAGGTIGMDFVRRFCAQDGEYLPAIRSLPDSERADAQAVIADFAQRGWVRPPTGNQPARWINRDGAMRQIGG